MPVYELLGGLYRDRLPLYWSHFASYRAIDPEALGVEPARTMDSWIALVDDVERGRVQGAQDEPAGARPDDRAAADAGRGDRPLPDRRRGRRSSARCASGSGRTMGILFDVGQEYRMGGIVRLARALEPFDLYWLEAEGFDPDALLSARRQTRTRICHGEALIRREQFRPFLERHVTDVVMVETLANGLSEARRICELAAHYDTMFSPHNYMSPLATLINAHLCAAMPNFEILEIDMDDVPWKWDLIDQKLDIVDGELIVPDRPGPRREHRRGGGRAAPAAARVARWRRPRLAFGYNPPTGNRLIERVDPATFAADLDRVLDVAAPSFESLWVSDHLMTEDRFRLECWTQLTWIAARFPGPLLGTIVMANSYRHPPLLAKMAASLQYLSGGRFILGYGAGWAEEEYRAYGYEFPSIRIRIEQMVEGIEVIRALWTGGRRPTTASTTG